MHAHGTLWLSLDNIESLLKNNDGTLRPKTKYEDNTEEGPFHGLKKAFRKFKNSEILNEEEKKPIREFIDMFTTVSIHENTDPALEQANADCDEEVLVEHQDFLHIDPGQISTEESIISN